MIIKNLKIIKNCNNNCKDCPKKDWCPEDNTMSNAEKKIVNDILKKAGVIS